MEKKVRKTHDILSDVLTRMRNAIASNKEFVVLPKTKMVLEVLKVMSNYGYINQYQENEVGDIVVYLKTELGYRFKHLERVSKPGLRIYVSAKDIRPVKGGKGLSIISTSRGVMSGDQAKKAGIGGEYLCNIW
ncbi:MAG: 30S ribosomal protein S8 [Candidatus Dojkabacteria bacterium]|jgi:small subunit ribosomal protein S8|nr:MAG: 30S ribosomal protein S8 [Candidatus Dojkabacteria bacterium]